MLKQIMNSKTGRMVACLAIAATMSTAAMAGSFEYHGYGRAGVLMNNEGGLADQSAPWGNDNGVFNVDNPASPFTWNNGRLGNENDNYYEGVLQNNFGAGKVSGKTVARLAYKDHYSASWNNASDSDPGVGLRELYTEMRGFDFNPGAKVWAGKRFYGREDIHINDFFMRIMDGTGIGIESLALGPGNLSMAFIACEDGRADLEYADAKKGRGVQKNFDVRYKIPALDGNIDFEANFATLIENADGMAEDGMILAAVYDRADYYMLGQGFSKIALQYGTGLNAGLDTMGTWFSEDAATFRFSTFGVGEFGDNLKLMSSIVYQQVEKYYSKDKQDNGKFQDGSWLGLTVRPEYYISRNFALVSEFSYENVLSSDFSWKEDAEGSAYKVTLAPTVTLDNTSFWTRPQLRAFVTFASWDEELKGSNGGDQYASETDGITYGVQMETWF